MNIQLSWDLIQRRSAVCTQQVRLHGNNRWCVVFGRVAGVACAKCMWGDKVKATSLAELSGGGLSGKVEASKLARGSYEDTINSAPPSAKSAGCTMEEVCEAHQER